MSQRTRRGFFLSLIVPLTLAQASCHPAAESQKIAEKFMDAYYVRLSVAEALPLTADLAKEKTEGQLKLLQEAGGPDATQDRPRVTYKLIDRMTAATDTATYIFEVRTHMEDVGKRMVFVKLRKEGKNWVITQFSEEDAPPS